MAYMTILSIVASAAIVALCISLFVNRKEKKQANNTIRTLRTKIDEINTWDDSHLKTTYLPPRGIRGLDDLILNTKTRRLPPI